jgi:NADP-dependent 3-hydroxy acid dehydrogenase YdfG
MKDFAGRSGVRAAWAKIVAQLVLKRGGSAIVVGRRDDRIAATVEELGHLGLVAGERADLTKMSDVEAQCSRIDSKHADIDHLVNAAGIFVPKAFRPDMVCCRRTSNHFLINVAQMAGSLLSP